MIPSTGAAIILAAGRGTRLNAIHTPKVMLPIGGKPLIAHTVESLQAAGLSPDHICVVIGFQGNQVRDFFGPEFVYAEQKELLGTAHAAYTGMRALSHESRQVLVMGGDDSAFYRPETLHTFFEQHRAHNAQLSLLTARVDDPSQLGRIVRAPDAAVRIVEKEYLAPDEAHIKEISTGTFCFDRAWFEEMFPSMPRMKKLNEYGLPAALSMAQEQGKRCEIVVLDDANEWFGVNTFEDLQEADRRKKSRGTII